MPVVLCKTEIGNKYYKVTYKWFVRTFPFKEFGEKRAKSLAYAQLRFLVNNSKKIKELRESMFISTDR